LFFFLFATEFRDTCFLPFIGILWELLYSELVTFSFCKEKVSLKSLLFYGKFKISLMDLLRGKAGDVFLEGSGRALLKEVIIRICEDCYFIGFDCSDGTFL